MMRDIRPNPRKKPPDVPPPQAAPESSNANQPVSSGQKPNPPKPKPRFSGSKVPVANVPTPKLPSPPVQKPNPPRAAVPVPKLPNVGQQAKAAAAKIKGTLAPFARTGISNDEVSKLSRKKPTPKPPKAKTQPAKPATTREPADLPPSKQKRKAPAGKPVRLGSRERLIIIVLILLVIVIGGLAAFIFLPKTDIRLVLRTAPLLVDETISIEAGDSSNPNAVPGTSFFREIEVVGSAPVTSTEVIGEKATGTVVLINRTFDEQDIKEQSRLVTDDGILFYMQQAVTIPAAEGSTLGSATVTVEAAEAGPEGNIGEQRLNFAALDESSQSIVYGEVREPLTGGAGNLVTVVKEPDLETARTVAGEQARSEVEQDIRSELPKDWIILDESWQSEIADFATDAQVDQRTDIIPYTARATVRVIGYEAKALEDVLRASLESRVEDEFMLFPGPISFTNTVDEVNWETGTATISTRVTHSTIPDLSLETLKAKLSGRSEDEASQYLQGLPGVRAVNITLWPFWATSIPRIDARINLDLEPEREL